MTGRSNYTEDYENEWQNIMWRGQVASAIRGKRGQALLRELVETLDAMPDKRLIRDELVADAPAFVPPEFARPMVCALGAVGIKRGIELKEIDPEDYNRIAETFNIAQQLVREIEWVNDDEARWASPERRWQIVRDWAAEKMASAR